ncbi:hypothetical protein DQ04_06291000 [Trypanosoma grayi]|uniref:hypothetical protein n=1 Tax=Trypanosoma grayi TaxID=71804 RepID=UPI0004F42D24|nr:hypothetical protein DQ04_06291000 [Trypanosoma grayi]KEG08864.1 hypothetical protein DQ04_06291000 [Trypanosoma grayi]
MGGIPSREAPPTFFSLRYGTHEVGLIPLVYRYFHSDNRELRHQFIRMRNDPSVRYSFMRDSKYDMKELPPPTYSEEKLDKFLGVIDETLYNSTEAMLEDEEAPLRPVPCAVCFVYVNGREGSDCFSFYGRRINVIGHFGCHTHEDRADENPCLHVRKAILKAAGDRTLERVVTLAGMVLKEEFFRAVMSVRPTANALDLFQRRISRLSLVTTTPWNSYPTLKFLYDSAVVGWAVGNISDEDDRPRFTTYEVETSGECGLQMEMSGALLLRAIMWVCGILTPSAVRSSWEQFVLDDARSQQKDKTVAHWLATSPHVKTFLGGEEFTAHVQAHLAGLLGEVVRARETPSDDQSLWCPKQEYSHDGKLYRIFNSPICGPFLTTVKMKQDKKGDIATERKGNGGFDQLKANNNDPRKRGVMPAKMRGQGNLTPQAYGGRPPPPQYQESINNVITSSYLAAPSPNICPIPLSTTALTHGIPSPTTGVPSMMMLSPDASMKPYHTQAGTIPVAPTFMPLFHGAATPNAVPVQPYGMPFMVVGASGQTVQQPNIIAVSGTGNGAVGGENRAAPPFGTSPPTATATPSTPSASTTTTTTTSPAAAAAQPAVNGAAFACAMNGMPFLDSASAQSLANYVLLPDGRIGMLSAAAASPGGYWS